MNHTIASKALKHKHLCESGNLKHRISVAVPQKNSGYSYAANKGIVISKNYSSEWLFHAFVYV